MKKLQILFFAIIILTSRLYALDMYDFNQSLKSQKIEQVTQLLANGFDVNMVSTQAGRTPLMCVAMRGESLKFYDYSSSFHCEVARMLLDAGVSIDRTNEYGQTALMIACSHTDMNMIHLLIDYGANIHVRDNRGNTVLMNAAHSGNIEVVKFLLQLGFDPLLRNQYGTTVLMAICSHNSNNVIIDLNTMRLLIKQNADCNMQDDRGRTALMEAAYYGNIEAVRLLLQLGANPFVKDKDGKTALQEAKHSWTYHFEQGYVSRAQEKQIIAMLKAAQRKNKK